MLPSCFISKTLMQRLQIRLDSARNWWTGFICFKSGFLIHLTYVGKTLSYLLYTYPCRRVLIQTINMWNKVLYLNNSDFNDLSCPECKYSMNSPHTACFFITTYRYFMNNSLSYRSIVSNIPYLKATVIIGIRSSNGHVTCKYIATGKESNPTNIGISSNV